MSRQDLEGRIGLVWAGQRHFRACPSQMLAAPFSENSCLRNGRKRAASTEHHGLSFKKQVKLGCKHSPWNLEGSQPRVPQFAQKTAVKGTGSRVNQFLEIPNSTSWGAPENHTGDPTKRNKLGTAEVCG